MWACVCISLTASPWTALGRGLRLPLPLSLPLRPPPCRYVVVDTCAMNGIDFGKTTDNSDIDMYKQVVGVVGR